MSEDIWGIGKKMVVSGASYFFLIIAVNHFLFPSFRFVIVNPYFNLFLGLTLVAFGTVVVVWAITTFKEYLERDELCTEGIYSVVRHPLYSAWILLLTPGLVLILGYTFLLTLPILLYGVFRILIKEEERKLLEEFGEDYEEYREKVNAIIPNISNYFKKIVAICS